MASRRDARRKALAILFEIDVSGGEAADSLAGHAAMGERVEPFTRELVEGVTEKIPELDRMIAGHSEGWRVERMPAVDRSILRLACYEIAFREDVPASVAISEAVQAAKDMSTEDSSRFVNGVLGAIERASA